MSGVEALARRSHRLGVPGGENCVCNTSKGRTKGRRESEGVGTTNSLLGRAHDAHKTKTNCIFNVNNEERFEDQSNRGATCVGSPPPGREGAAHKTTCIFESRCVPDLHPTVPAASTEFTQSNSASEDSWLPPGILGDADRAEFNRAMFAPGVVFGIGAPAPAGPTACATAAGWGQEAQEASLAAASKLGHATGSMRRATRRSAVEAKAWLDSLDEQQALFTVAAWPGCQGTAWEGSTTEFRSFSTPSGVASEEDAHDPFHFGWDLDSRDEIAAQGRFLGSRRPGAPDYVHLRESELGPAPPRSDQSAFECYEIRTEAFYLMRKLAAGLDEATAPLSPTWADLYLVTADGTEHPLRREIVGWLVQGVDSGVSATAAGSWTTNMPTTKGDLMARILREHMEIELERGWIREWDLGGLRKSLRFVASLGFVEKKPDVGEPGPNDPLCWRLIRDFTQARSGTSLNDRLPRSFRPNWLNWTGIGDLCEGVVELWRENGNAPLEMCVIDLSKQYRQFAIAPSLWHQFSYTVPDGCGGSRTLYDTRMPFGWAGAGYYAVLVSQAILWGLRHVELPLIGATDSWTGHVWVDDYALVASPTFMPTLRAGLIALIEKAGFKWRGKEEEGLGDQGEPGVERVWIGNHVDLERGCVQTTARMRRKCLVGGKLLLASAAAGRLGGLELCTLDSFLGRCSFMSWCYSRGRAELRTLWAFQSLLDDREGEDCVAKGARANASDVRVGRPRWDSDEGIAAQSAIGEWMRLVEEADVEAGFDFRHFAEAGHSDGLVQAVYTDAQPGGEGKRAGFGILVAGFAVAGVFPDRVLERASAATGSPDNNYLEAVAMNFGSMIMERVLSQIWSDPGVAALSCTDSSTAEASRRHGGSRSSLVNLATKGFGELFHHGAAHAQLGPVDPQRTQARRVLSAACLYADALSRWDEAGGAVYRPKLDAELLAIGVTRDDLVFLSIPDDWFDIGFGLDLANLTPLGIPQWPAPRVASAFRVRRTSLDLQTAAGPFARPRTARERRSARLAPTL